MQFVKYLFLEKKSLLFKYSDLVRKLIKEFFVAELQFEQKNFEIKSITKEEKQILVSYDL